MFDNNETINYHVITLFVLFGLSYGITYYTQTKMIDYSFFIGLAITIIIWFLTSKGGFTSRNLDMTVQGTTGIKAEEQKFEFTPNVLFFTSLSYTIISLVAMLFYYRSYF
ncbi:hypothetical protein E2K98_29740 [Bacillus salipaludis]|uniref:Uncharacterized protein n=1 Tax=Bacillus salipaludis TaxID=2547811 RepID=A0A4R5VI21_9BACI|nr:hypothetical protein [Bacillus salipaludis]TDK54071.1 hypothetical protein E2K98_29740 [Bacillus salipaludis]